MTDYFTDISFKKTDNNIYDLFEINKSIMGSCNCGYSKNDPGTVLVEHLRTITLQEDLSLGVKLNFSETNDNDERIQALIRGYLARRSFFQPKIASPLKKIYHSLGKFDLGVIPENSYRMKGGVYIGEVDSNNEPHGRGRLFLNVKICEGS